MIRKIKSLVRIVSGHGGIKAEQLVPIKGHPDEPIIRDIVRFSHSRRGALALKLIERDKWALIKQLKDVPTDPRPLPSSNYATEAEAIHGCATPVIGARFLYSLVRAIQPKRIVEIGAAHGYGACYMATAMKHSGRLGEVDTLEGMTVRAKYSTETIQRLGLQRLAHVHFGDFRETLPKVLTGATDMVFSDGDKSVDLTRWHFDLCLERMSQGYLVFDDINFDAEISELFSEFVAEPRIAWALTFEGRWAILRLESG
jgi:predicted O-methyltransferase YrrM